MFKQFLAAISLGLRTIPSRKGASLVVVTGMACAVGALVSIGSMSAGLNRQMANNGRDDRALVLSRNAVFEFPSAIPATQVPTIADAPGIRHTPDGKPIVSGEAIASVSVPTKNNGLEMFIELRGIGPQGLALRPEVHLISGRMFQPGKYEVIVGKSAAAEYQGLEENSHIALPDGDWTIVGTFEAEGNPIESNLLTDADTLRGSTRAANVKSVRVMLDSPDRFDAFKAALISNPTLTLDVERERDYNIRNNAGINELLTAITVVVGGIMGLGALFGALNTMYAGVSTRAVEIATLRAIGFGGGSVMASVLVEAVLLALSGALIGCAVAWVLFNGNLHDFGGDVIHLAVTPGLIMTGLLFATSLALVGGFFPALRAARRPIVDALRAT